MKVRVTYTVEVSDELRRAIRAYYGQEGLATRQEVQEWYEHYGDSNNDDCLYDFMHSEQIESELNERKTANP
jgi:hypothetical protein